MSERLARGTMLLRMHRLEEAVEEFQAAIAEDVDNGMLHAYLALTLADLKRYPAALLEARQAIHLMPDESFCYYVLGHVLLMQGKPKEALKAAAEALALDPSSVNVQALRSAIYLDLSRWREGLAAAEAGLELDPEDVECANLKAACLRQLGQHDSSAATLASALERDPDNATTHATLGWTQIHDRQYQQALLSFREALRLEPNHHGARAGMVSAMKARHPAYALMLRFFVWIGRFPPKYQFGLAIGLIVGLQVFARLGDNYSWLEPWVSPILMVYCLFVLATWLSDPFFNLVLSLDRYGRYALSRLQKVKAVGLGLCLLIIGTINGYLLTRGIFEPWLVVITFLCVFPVLTAFGAKRGKVQAMAGLVAAGLIAALLLAVFANQRTLHIYILGCVISSWAVNAVPKEQEL